MELFFIAFLSFIYYDSTSG